MARVRITVSNAGSGTHTFSIALSSNGAAPSNGDWVCDAINLAKNVEYETAEYTLEAGTVVRVKTDDGTDFTFQAHGVEYYTPAQAAYFDVIEGGVQSTVKLYNLEDNLTYVFYTDEDSLARVGFRGYGPDNELAVNFPSPYERSNFLTALDNARFYGYGIYGPPSTPTAPVYLGDNTIAGASTTTTSTTSTTTTSTSTTTTTTAAPGTTTSTTSTTTTAGPPTITLDFGRTASTGMYFSNIELYSATVEDGIAYSDTLLFTAQNDSFTNTSNITWDSISEDTILSGFLENIPASTLHDAYLLTCSLSGGNSYYQFRLYDVTDSNNPSLIGALPQWPVPEGEDPADYPEYGKSPNQSYALVTFNEGSGVPLYPGRAYRLEVRTYWA
jgi:hypothetical protein